MELSELISYAEEKYGIPEEKKWKENPGWSVLCHPSSGKWLALIIREWNPYLWEETVRCDVKCGDLVLPPVKNVSPPFLMRGWGWKGIVFNDDTDSQTVFKLFDRAYELETSKGHYTMVLEPLASSDKVHRDTPLPFSRGSSLLPGRVENKIPDRIRKLKQMAPAAPIMNPNARTELFYRQGKFMEDYEDDAPINTEFFRYYPTYQDMRVSQLRTYFSWRTLLRKGQIRPVSFSYAYVYIYELLNGIGTGSPEETVEKLRKFEKDYVDAGYGNFGLKLNIQNWIYDLTVIYGLAPDPEYPCFKYFLEQDKNLEILRHPDNHNDEEIFYTLLKYSGKGRLNSSFIKKYPDKAVRLFAECWRLSLKNYRLEDKDLFDLCFGELKPTPWKPLDNAMFLPVKAREGTEYRFNDFRFYRFVNGRWQKNLYSGEDFNLSFIDSFVRETECLLRKHYKGFRPMAEKEDFAWLRPFVDQVVEKEKEAEKEASRPKIEIDLSGLEKIRLDALKTQNSLLTEEERLAEDEIFSKQAPPEDIASEDEEEDSEGIPLAPSYVKILKALLKGEDPAPVLKAERLMPSIAADVINEALFDMIGDVVLQCDNDRLSVSEDYEEDLRGILEGKTND